MVDQTSLGALLKALPDLGNFHAPDNAVYAFLELAAREQAIRTFGQGRVGPQQFGMFGSIDFPFHNMGAVDSVDLFGLDELILFAYYWRARGRYARVADIGANLGLHSILLDRCGFEVRAYEPDPAHWAILRANLIANQSVRVSAIQAAVSSEPGSAEFIRVAGNTTSSHLAGSKPAPYGDLQRFPVTVEAIQPIMAWADLLKVDAEGHEKQIFLATSEADWQGTDMLVEVGSSANANAIYAHSSELGLKLFAQKRSWHRIDCEEDMPTSYRDGTLFVTAADRQSMW